MPFPVRSGSTGSQPEWDVDSDGPAVAAPRRNPPSPSLFPVRPGTLPRRRCDVESGQKIFGPGSRALGGPGRPPTDEESP